ncbi:Methyltransferase domain-containing protein [Phyllobacterium sp. CL33Tsu]|uniref:class I SAM-dependent methyltransferase n=1 Tax=Phyllobacterium sp. CL33Tsu TaxID=1798191 RepID=UPI0008EE2F88|nr:class I SAM-dependent methyltransferase [Phyllobacterium sp. CL33Tsu]SFI82211.1 Methyltransferase domain-containing protein [Phyllobacterium sp. CL33Tsu]
MLVERVLSRPEQLFEKIDQATGIGLEIGALDNPCALRSVGKVYYADYCSTDNLRRNHQHTPTVNVQNIVDVDFITDGGPLARVVPNNLRFDYVIASHVIEHVPDIISWLCDVGDVLRQGGVLSLIIPNKEKTFDSRRSVSEEKDFYGAFIQKQTRPSPTQVFDSFRWHEREGKLVHTLDYAIDKAMQSVNDYVDCHCWVFTPQTFFHEIGMMAHTGRIPFKLDVVTLTPRDEIDMFARLIRV